MRIDIVLTRTRYSTATQLGYKSHTSAKKVVYGRLSKNVSIACSPVPLKLIESLVLDEIGSITTRPSADDVVIGHPCRDAQGLSIINNALKYVSEWSGQNGLNLNPNKCVQ